MTKANKGVATLKEGDAKSDSNEKGNGNFVDKYTDNMNGKCGVVIRIGADKDYANRTRFEVADCASQNPCKNKTASETLFLNKK